MVGFCEIQSTEVFLRVSVVGQSANFYLHEIGRPEERLIAQNVSAAKLNSDETMSHTGTYVGLYATANGHKSQNTAIFKMFSYTGNDNL